VADLLAIVHGQGFPVATVGHDLKGSPPAAAGHGNAHHLEAHGFQGRFHAFLKRNETFHSLSGRAPGGGQ
jgi:hypothetical protein